MERDEMLDLAFSLLPSLSEDVLSREGVLEKLIQLCIHRGRTEKALHVISAMRARKVPVSVNCFNQVSGSGPCTHPKRLLKAGVVNVVDSFPCCM